MSDPGGNGFAGWKHLTSHFLWFHMETSYEEIVDRASEMARLRAAVRLPRGGFPNTSTRRQPFERPPTRIWRQLLDRSVDWCVLGDHSAVDVTFFARQAVSSHYVDRSDRPTQPLKTTPLVDIVPCSLSTARHTSPTTRRWAVRWHCASLTKVGVSLATKAITLIIAGHSLFRGRPATNQTPAVHSLLLQ